ncbi:hypothetical protein RhiJN_22334 [Ceratobasidium sp. AG-Ba]|nr:hypothetical protein RhiJN_22334 [Ceratobasidium sp. AG-Ba]
MSPRLEVLHLFVRHPDDFLHDESTIFVNISQLGYLCALECTAIVLDPIAMRLLATLPQLESLKITSVSLWTSGYREYSTHLNDLVLPDGSFRKLKHLALQLLSYTTIARVWTFPQLVRGLRSVELGFTEFFTGWGNDVIRDVCAASPDIEELTLDFGDVDPEFHNYEIFNVYLENLQLRSLRRLRIRDGTAVYRSHESFIPLLLDYWNNMEYLDISTFPLHLEDLVLFAAYLPKLRLLSIPLDLRNWRTILDPESITPSPVSVCLKGRFDVTEPYRSVDEQTPELMEELDVAAR